MKKLVKLVVLLLVVSTVVSCFIGCNKNEGTQNYDPETRPLTMSIGALDGNFNPFFYTAQNDGNVVGMTQVSMLASDAQGNPVVGENRPTVAKDFSVTEAADRQSTTYEFLIKNGMKYSDGQELNIMDVLFNFYVYLDEAYIGSNTLYSTDIKGLKAYHAQDVSLNDDSDVDTYETFLAAAYTRQNNVIDYCTDGYCSDDEQAKKDIVTIINLFKNEVKSDWTNVENSFNSSIEEASYEYRFTEAWEAYLFNEGIIGVLTEKNAQGATIPRKDANGKYFTNLDEDDTYRNELNEYVNNANNIAKYTSTGASAEQAKEFLKRDWAIDFVFSANTGIDSVNTTVTTIDGTTWKDSGIAGITQYWATGSTALEQFTSEERTAYYANKFQGGSLAVPTITGISAYRTNTFKGVALDTAYDVLRVVINDVDPKAIWNFSVTIAPMHYYSTPELVAAADADYNNYLNAYANGQSYEIKNFGVKFADANFFGEGGLQSGEKNRLPIGAGAYKASTASGGNGNAAQFYTNKFVYYERNTYFETMGADLNNAIIKSVRYAEIGDDKVITALINKEIDYGMPSGNSKNATRIAEASEYLGSARYMSNGYGYVGINPKFIPELEVRQAIMKALNTASTVTNYYTDEWASVINRPMSANSWAYPTGATQHDSIKFTSNAAEINQLIEDAGYRENASGIYEKNGKQLKLTFTIAGSSTEHPAYKMFTDAEAFLEANCHMDITVATDIQALKKLASGNLAVWAAAWSSSIDPDMYQVYHKDSKATSVKNWNYPEILADTTSKFERERDIIDELSEKIDAGRKTTNQNERKAYYSEALDLVMSLAVELPTYQRNDYEVYNKEVIKAESLTANPSAFSPLFDRLWEVSYN